MHTLHRQTRRWLALPALLLLAHSVMHWGWFSPGLVSARLNATTPAPLIDSTALSPAAVGVATFAPDCTTPQTAFNLGGTVCAQVTGIDPPIANAHFDFVDPDGIIQQRGPNISTDGQTATFPLPASGGNAKLGTWKVNIAYNSDSSVIATVNFTVAPGCPTITLGALANATTGSSYNGSVAASPAGSYTYSVMSGSLPTGLTLNPTTGALTGTAVPTGTFNFTIKAQDLSSCSGMRAYTLVFTCPAITINPPTLPIGLLGVAYNQMLSATGGVAAYTFTLALGSSLPSGLTLAANGTLSGTPTAPGPVAFTVNVTDANNCGGTGVYTIDVQCPVIGISPASLSNPMAGVPYNQTLTGTGGAGPYTFGLISGALPAGLSLAGNTLSGTPTALGASTFTIGVTDVPTNCSGNRAYTVTVVCPALTLTPATLPNGALGTAYSQNLVASPAGGNYTYAVTTNVLPPGLSLNAMTGAITGTPSAAGSFAFGITATGFGGCTVSLSYSLLISGFCGTITVNPTMLTAGTQGAAYNTTITTTGGVAPFTFSVFSGALPSGLTLNASSGVISGIPTATGTFALTIRATAASGCTGQRSYVLMINCGTVTLDQLTLPNGTKNVAYSQTLTASPAGTYMYNVLLGSLPPGFVLSTAGVLSGTSSTTGTYTFTIRARTASGCQGTRSYTISINP